MAALFFRGGMPLQASGLHFCHAAFRVHLVDRGSWLE